MQNNSDYDTDEKTPFKWKKHLILPFFGLRTIENLKNDIHRYKKEDVNSLIEAIRMDMENGMEKSSYIIAFIPLQQEYKVPNVIINTIEDLEDFRQNYSENTNNKYTELWFFKKIKDRDSSNLVGRISFNLIEVSGQAKSLECRQTLEQVWHTNHREIEKYNQHANSIFLQASRADWGRQYKIDNVLIPEGQDGDYERILKQFRQVAITIEGYREKIEEFCKHLQKLDINEVSLEYMVSKGRLYFIDWDSSNDKKVVNSIINDRERER